MALSDELVSQFAKLMKPEEDKTQESTLYGKFVIHNGKKYVQLDGSELLTPVEQTATAKEGDRVSVTIKNHNATVTGNYSSPAARSGDVDENSKKILEVGTLVAGKASIEDLKATNATVGNLVADNATIKNELKAANATIETISADNVTIKETLKANKAAIDDLDANKLSANVADLKYATIEKLEATNADIHNLSADYGEFKQATVDDLSAKNATIQKLQTEKLSATDADLRYANIDFSNIGKAAIEQFYATSGIIKDLVIGDQTITGELVGVTIKGDLIEGGTVVADKLVVKGQNGLYYKLNTDGVTTEAEQTDYNSLNGSVITAKSITASKVNVKDLVAFDATIGGFNITDKAIYSGVKSSVDNTTRGIYQDKDGQLAVGDGSNYLKYFKDSDGKYKLEISAASLKFSASNKNLETVLGDTITKTVEEFYLSSSPTSLSGGSWSTKQPTWTEGKYIWRRTAVTYGDGSSEYTPSTNGVCITGNTGAKGEKGATGATGPKGDVGAGGNIIRNGYGEYLDNTNFEGGTFYKGDCPDGAYGYFCNGLTEEYLFDPTKIYDLEFYIRQHKGSETGIGWFSIQPIDVDGFNIKVYNILHKGFNKHLFYLEKDLNPGDTKVYFKDLSNWRIDTDYYFQRNFLFFGYSDSTGYTYPDGTYSRYAYLGIYSSNNDVDKTNNTITLKTPWNHEVFKAGTCVAQNTDGNAWCYYGASGYKPPVNEWKQMKDVVYAGSKNGSYSENAERLRYAKKIRIFLGICSNQCPDYSKISLRERVVNSIKSTAITYQAGASGTTAPTGTWSPTVPATDASKPYMWTKTVITYTDDTTSTSYSVGSTPDGVQVGGRNLLYQYIRAGGCTSKIDDKSIKIGTEFGDTYFYLKTHVALVKGETYTISCDASNVPSGCNWSFGIRTTLNPFQLCINKNGRCSATGIIDVNYNPNDELALDDSDGRPSTAPNIILSNFKLEKGNKATDWTPAPEDQVEKAKIISEINQSPEQISIKASKISLEGIVTANERFKILEDGSMEATSGKFTGEIHATSGKFGGDIDATSFRVTKQEVTVELSINNSSKWLSGLYVHYDKYDAKYSSYGIELIAGPGTENNHTVIDYGQVTTPRLLVNGNAEITYKLSAPTISATTITASSFNAGSNASLWTDGEGGNLAILAPNGHRYEMDAYNGSLRIYHGSGDFAITLLGSDAYTRLNHVTAGDITVSGAINAGSVNGMYKIRCGTVVLNSDKGTGTARVFMYHQDVINWLGMNIDPYKVIIVANNGDGNASGAHFDCVTYIPSHGYWAVTFDRTIGTGPIRINFAIIYGY